MKENDKCFLSYIYFTPPTMQRYMFTGWVLKNDYSYRDSSQKLTVVNTLQTIHGTAVRSNCWWYGDRYIKRLHWSILTRTRTHQSSRNIQIWTQNGTCKNKRKKEIIRTLDLSKLTLFGIRDRTTTLMSCAWEKVAQIRAVMLIHI